jgi:hypothetical protein
MDRPPPRWGFVRPLPVFLLALVFAHFTEIDEVFSSLPADFERRLVSVELFSGQAEISKAVRDQWGLGLGGEAGSVGFDKRYHASQDLSCASGFKLALPLVWAIIVGGMLWSAPVCSSWVWISRSRTGRSRDSPGGCRRHLSVVEANAMVEYTVHLCVLAFARGCNIYVEQPQSSVMPFYHAMDALFQWISPIKLGVSLGKSGSDTLKPIYVWITERDKRIHHRIRGGRRAAAAAAEGEPLAKKARKSQLCTRAADGSVTGNKDAVKSSQHYPEAFGKCAADCAVSSCIQQAAALFRPA